MSSLGHQKRASEQSALLERKRKITEQVKSRFSRYGDDILRVILAFALSSRRMPMLLQGLGQRVSAELEDQLEGVSAFVATRGPHEFLKRLEAITGRRIVPRHSTQPGYTDDSVSVAELESLLASISDLKPLEDDVILKPVYTGNVYTGSKRRSGKERRSSKDRRDDCEAVNKNKRFGGDRRKRPYGRRKSDYEK